MKSHEIPSLRFGMSTARCPAQTLTWSRLSGRPKGFPDVRSHSPNSVKPWGIDRGIDLEFVCKCLSYRYE
jgi:hypothetical protein